MGVEEASRKEPWEEFPEIWPTKAKFFSWLRGCLRGGVWNKYPPKLMYKKSLCQVPSPEWYKGRAKAGGVCALTGEWNVQSKMEVDHIHGNVSLNGWSDVLPFIQHLCATKNNMQVVGKEAHKVKSYAERQGMSFEEALLEKKVIALLKDKRETARLLRENRMIAKNDKERREKVRNILARTG